MITNKTDQQLQLQRLLSKKYLFNQFSVGAVLGPISPR